MPPAQYKANRRLDPLDLKGDDRNDDQLLNSTKTLNNLLTVPIQTCIYSVVLSFIVIFFIITFNYFNES